MSEHKCEGKVWTGLHFHRCGKTARYEHEGKWYCKRHHPPTEQAKRDARSKKFREEFEARQQASREAEEARAEMQRKAAAYDGLVAQRDALLEALHIAEAALSDIGDADREPGDDVAWCEARAAEAIPKARDAIKMVEEGK